MTNSDDYSAFLSDTDCQKLLLALAKGSGSQGFNDEQGEIVLAWAHEARVTAALVDMAIAGALRISVDADGQVLVEKDAEAQR